MKEALGRDIAALCQHLHARGWVANHDGNVSARLGDRFLASPTAVSKADVRADMLVEVEAGAEGFKVVAGERRVFSEFSLHLTVFQARPDVRWVCHAHPPFATAWAVSGRSFWERPFMAEPVVSLGAQIPVVDAAELGAAVAGCDAVLLRNHRVITVGKDAETARLRMELVEHLARIAAIAQPLGGPVPLPLSEVERGLEARAKAGLGATSSPVSSATPPLLDTSALVAEALARLR